MKWARHFNSMDALGVLAVLFSHLNWTFYQLSSNLRTEREVYFAITAALVLGLSYRFVRQRMEALYEEVASRVILLLSGLLVLSGWVTESVALVAGANLWFLLKGARFSRNDTYLYEHTTPWFYLLLVLIPAEVKYGADLPRWVIGFYLMLTFVGGTQRQVHRGRNPYQDVAAFFLAAMLVAFLPAACITLILSPRSTTPEGQMVERAFAALALAILLVVAALYVWERRQRAGRFGSRLSLSLARLQAMRRSTWRSSPPHE